MTKIALLAATAVATFAVPAHAGVVLTFGGVADATATYNFDGPTPDYSGTIYTDSVVNDRLQPAGSTGGYAAVGPGNAETSATLDLSGFGAIDTISFIWGSPDGYNSLSVDGTTFSFTGSGLAEGVYTLTFTDADRTGVTGLTFASLTEDAFEFDNVDVSAIPEPATWAMMIGGFGFAGGALRTRARKGALTA